MSEENPATDVITQLWESKLWSGSRTMIDEFMGGLKQMGIPIPRNANIRTTEGFFLEFGWTRSGHLLKTHGLLLIGDITLYRETRSEGFVIQRHWDTPNLHHPGNMSAFMNDLKAWGLRR